MPAPSAPPPPPPLLPSILPPLASSVESKFDEETPKCSSAASVNALLKEIREFKGNALGRLRHVSQVNLDADSNSTHFKRDDSSQELNRCSSKDMASPLIEKPLSTCSMTRQVSECTISSKNSNGQLSTSSSKTNPSSKRLPALKSDNGITRSVSPLVSKSPGSAASQSTRDLPTETITANSAPEVKLSMAVPPQSQSKPAPPFTTDSATKPNPVIREGKGRWVVRNQRGTEHEQLCITIDEAQIRDSIRIEKCEHVYVDIVDKVNAVTILGCTKTQTAMQSVIASLEVTRCSNCDVQIAHIAPTINIENSSCINMFLMDRTQVSDMDIVTSCSSAVNINIRPESEDDNVAEYALPQQFVSRIMTDENGNFKISTQPREGC